VNNFNESRLMIGQAEIVRPGGFPAELHKMLAFLLTREL
jgi:hypothetical protein